MTHVALLELSNWYRFRSARLALGPRAYAVEAEAAGDPARSNWLGKSSLVEAVAFALYGWHRAQEEPERAAGYEDRWIRGRPGADADVAKEGGVALTLSTGLRVERTRRRGLSTQLRVSAPGVRRTVLGSDSARCSVEEVPLAAGDEAQRLIDSAVGFGEGDFLSLPFARQREVAQLVLAKPSERMKLVAEWLQLERLERAADSVSKRVRLAGADAAAARVRAGQMRARLAELEAEEHFGLHAADRPLADLEAAGQVAVGAARDALSRAQESREARAAWEVAEQGRRRVADLALRLSEAEAALARLPKLGPAPDPSEARGRLVRANERLRDAQKLARGEFDGRCPVRAGFACPAKDGLNAGVAEARLAEQEARSEAKEAERAGAAASERAEEHARRARERQRAEDQVELLRSELSAARPPAERPEPPAISQARVEELRAAERALTAQLAGLGRAAAEIRSLRQRVEAEEAKAEEAGQRAAELRCAALVLGRGGAQRRVAEAACAQIARIANQRLAAGGVALSVALRWRDEGAELAASCEACGEPFGRSQAVKVCKGCGEARPRSAHDRLTVQLSDRSGAAEDLAGLWLQRAAFEWLRARRSSPWRSMVLDEPFGALDAAHRRVVVAEVARMARESGEQLLVVSHQPGVLESLPGRIVVRGDGRGESTAEVVE